MKQFNSNLKNTIIRFKLENGCSICGYKKVPQALHFHHIVPSDKKYDIAKLIQTSKYYTIIEELKKCALLCANCHSEQHALTIATEEVTPININNFITLCIQEDAITDNDIKNDEITMGLYIEKLQTKLHIAQYKLRKYEADSGGGIEPQESHNTPIITITSEINDNENLQVTLQQTKKIHSIDEPTEQDVIDAFKHTQSVNKVMQMLYGEKKTGTFYRNKVLPVLLKHKLIIE